MTMPGDDHVSNVVAPSGRRVEIFTGSVRRREWSAEQKAAIVAESYGGGASVCDVARRHGLTPSQLFAWRRYARREAATSVDGTGSLFVPALVAELPSGLAEVRSGTGIGKPSPALEVKIAGAKVSIWRGADAGLVAAVVRALRDSR